MEEHISIVVLRLYAYYPKVH